MNNAPEPPAFRLVTSVVGFVLLLFVGGLAYSLVVNLTR